jgi:hypothetical protein
VVAPPGAGKTIVGIEMAIRLGEPCMVVCPNTAIQGQWAKKLEMFVPGGDVETAARLATTDAANPKWMTALTYQILSIPENAGDGMIEIAEGIWAETLVEGGMEETEARARIARMKQANAAATARRWRATPRRCATASSRSCSGGMPPEGMHPEEMHSEGVRPGRIRTRGFLAFCTRTRACCSMA